MPKRSGRALARALLDKAPELPIILVTGYSETVTPNDAEEIGIADYLVKPVEKGDLGRAVGAALDRAPSRKMVK